MPAVRIFSNWVFAQWVRLSEQWHTRKLAVASGFWGKMSRQSLNPGLFCHWTTVLPHQVTTCVCLSPGENETCPVSWPSCTQPPTRAALGISFVLSLATKVLLHYREMETGGYTSRPICLLPLPSTCAICMQNKTPYNWATIQIPHFQMPGMESKKQAGSINIHELKGKQYKLCKTASSLHRSCRRRPGQSLPQLVCVLLITISIRDQTHPFVKLLFDHSRVLWKVSE